MPSKLLFVVDAHTKFEVTSFSRSKDIGVRILKIWPSSAILDSILSGFSQIRSFPGATEYHRVKFEYNLSRCGWVRAIKPFFQRSHFGRPNWGNGSQCWGSRCTGSTTDENTVIDAIHFCFIFLNFFAVSKSQRSEASGGEKRGKNPYFLTPCEK